jgi:hypothetical protein
MRLVKGEGCDFHAKNSRALPANSMELVDFGGAEIFQRALAHECVRT